MSGRSDVSSPSMSTTKRSMRHEEGADTVPETRGWLRKEGETLHNLYKRYMVLKGCTLSNHRNEEGSATWTVDMTQASVRTGPRKNEVVLSLPQKRISLFAADEADQARWVAAMKVAIAGGRSVDTHYKLGRLLGEGAFAQVRLAADRETGEHVAVKIIKKSEFAPQEMEYIRREVQVCRHVFHPNVIETRDIFDTSAELFIVLELLSGGELFDQIAEAGSFTEKQAAQVMREITKGVAYLHKNNVCHGDLKVRGDRRWLVPRIREPWSRMVGTDVAAPHCVYWWLRVRACRRVAGPVFVAAQPPDAVVCMLSIRLLLLYVLCVSWLLWSPPRSITPMVCACTAGEHPDQEQEVAFGGQAVRLWAGQLCSRRRRRRGGVGDGDFKGACGQGRCRRLRWHPRLCRA